MKPAESSAADGTRQSAFTRIDLMVIILTLGFLALMLLPALARTRVKPQGTQCLYNLRQIILAWQMYADDSNGKSVPNHGAFPANPDYSTPPTGVTYKARWVAGDMRGGSVGAPYTGIIDATNSALLVDPNYSSLGPYVKNPASYRCPADLSTWSVTGTPGQNEQPRVRSYSMNQGVGCAFNGTRQDPGHNELGHWLTKSTTPGPWQTYIKNSDLIGILPPSDLFVMLDEHPDSINDGAFAVYMPVNPTDTRGWIDVPAGYHMNGCDFSFADGHAEFHKWMDPAGIPPVIWAADETAQYGNGGSVSVAPDPDMLWLAHHATCLQPGVNGTSIYYP